MPTPTVTDRLILAVTDADGRYTMDNVPVSATLTLKEPGYALTKVPVGAVITQDVALQPFQVKALYVTAPYGKLVHGVYRLGALLLYRVEEVEAPRIRS